MTEHADQHQSEEPGPTMLEVAQAYRERGRPVFPVCSPAMGRHRHGGRGSPDCDKAGKRPLVAWEPFQTRLPTDVEVLSWWTRWPNANIGMATGALSGVIVLDCDSGEAKKLAMERGGLDQAPALFTGKPGGVHFHLAHPGATVHNFARRLPGVDLRADGGYAILPPSRHQSGAVYRWVGDSEHLPPVAVPAWLLDLLSGAGEGEAAGDPLNLDELLFGVPEGRRDDAMWRLACKLRADGLQRRYAELLVSFAALNCRPPFDVTIAVEKVWRAYHQYEPDPTFTVGDSATGPEEEPASADATAYVMQQIVQVCDMDDDAASPHLIDGILWANRATWVFSDPNTGKTLFLLALLLHVAAGRPFCGRAVKQGPVVLIEEDSPLSVLAEYVELLAGIYEFDLPSLPFWVNKLQGLRLTDLAGVQTAIDAIRSCPQQPILVLFDACERLVPSDRFTTKELDPLTRLFSWMVSESITPVMIDHTVKDRPRKGETPITPMDKLYGARAKSAISDVMLYFDGALKGTGVTVSFTKFRGEAPPAFTLRFNAVDGFELRSERISPRSAAEQDVMRFFTTAPREPYPIGRIEEVTAVSRRTLKRTLQVLVKRGWLIAHGGLFDRVYALNPAAPGLFE